MKKMKILALSMGLAFMGGSAFGQCASSGYAKTYIQNNNDINNSTEFITLADGSIVYTGKTQNGAFGGYDLSVTKVDLNGSIIWKKSYGGSKYDEGTVIKETSLGNFIVVGKSTSFSNNSDYDAYVLHLDNNGNIIWSDVYGSSDYEAGLGVLEASDGNFIVSGEQSSTNPSYYWFKVNSFDGSLIWSKTQQQHRKRVTQRIRIKQQLNNGNYLMVGKFSSHARVMEINDQGIILKSETYRNINLTDAIQLSNNNVLLVGNKNNTHAVMLEVDGTNYSSIVWQKQIKLNNAAVVSVEGINGGYLFSGQTNEYGDVNNVFLIKTDLTGNILQSKLFSQPMPYSLRNIEVDINGNAILIGNKDGLCNNIKSDYIIKTDCNFDFTCNSLNINPVASNMSISTYSGSISSSNFGINRSITSNNPIDFLASTEDICEMGNCCTSLINDFGLIRTTNSGVITDITTVQSSNAISSPVMFLVPTAVNGANVQYYVQVGTDQNFQVDLRERIGENGAFGPVTNHFWFNQLECVLHFARTKVSVDGGVTWGCWSDVITIDNSTGTGSGRILNYQFGFDQNNLEIFCFIDPDAGVRERRIYQNHINSSTNTSENIDGYEIRVRNFDGSQSELFYKNVSNSTTGSTGGHNYILDPMIFNSSCTDLWIEAKAGYDYDNDGTIDHYESCYGTPRDAGTTTCANKSGAKIKSSSNLIEEFIPSYRVSPNPFTNQINVKVNAEKDEVLTITISDLAGKVLSTSSNYTTNSNIQLGEALGTGMYLIQLSFGENEEIVKIIKN